LDHENLAYACKGYFDRLSDRLLKTPGDIELLRRLIEAAKLIPELPFDKNLWKPQNVYFDISQTIQPEWSKRARQGDEAAKLWERLIAECGEALGFAIPPEQEVQDAPPVEDAKLEEAAVVSAS
jgi:hypothetical protein